MARPTPRTDFARPRLVLSKCLEMDACRYNGQLVRSFAVRLLEPFVDFKPVCPEVEIGLGIPRDPIRLVMVDEVARLIQPSTGHDLTDRMADFAHGHLSTMPDVDGFLLKSKSPSCGIDPIKVYAAPEDAPPIGKQPGVFASAVLERFPDMPVEHEGRMTNLGLRDHFFTRIFALAELRESMQRGRMPDLISFHARQKLTLMAHSPSMQRVLGRLVANDEGAPTAEILQRYAAGFREALARKPSKGRHVNVIQHAQGYFKDGLSATEKAHFLALQPDYLEGRIGRGALLAVVQSWVHRFGEAYLASQAYLSPYPRELLELTDSGGSGGRR